MELPIQKEGRYTYADYLTWDDGQRWELINGKYGRPDIYCERDTIRCFAVKGLPVDLSRVFA